MKTLLPITTALALAGAVNLSPAMAQAPNPPGSASGTLGAQEGSDQSGLREILVDLAAGRNVSARISPPL
jgi:hypothetical protein